MPRKTRNRDHKFVPHPRYGVTPNTSGHTAPASEILIHWRYRGATIFIESALPADISRQDYTVIPIVWYVDILKKCRDCKRNFIFYAEEQKYWYEDLGFTINADCVRCPECRKTDQTLRRRLKRYSENFARPDLDDGSLATLISDTLFLWEHALLKNEQKLRQLKNLAHRRLPDDPVTRQITELVARLPARNPDPL